MRQMPVWLFSAMLFAGSTSTSSAQLLAAKDGPIVYGHHHLTTNNLDAQKKFFVDTLGGTLIKVGAEGREIVRFPNVLVFFRSGQAPTGGTRGSTVNHIGFSVPNIRQAVDRLKASGYQMITKTEAPAGRQIENDIAAPAQPGGNAIAFVLGPEDVKVELVEARQQVAPIALHHVHFFTPQNAEMRAWYAKVFGATLRETPAFLVGDLPGVALNFTKSDAPTVGTPGRAIDHIGFEVKNLEAFTKKLEDDGITLATPFRKAAALNIWIAFVTDPWGTSIELTEGLDTFN
jgi:catechol 2,3-dioxygenase-like lactoylglutathione lyase family enzyme